MTDTELADYVKELKQERDTLKLIFEHVPVNIFWTNTEGKFLGCNASLANLSGYAKPEDLIGLDHYEILPKKLAERLRETDQQVLKNGKAHVVEEAGLDKAGKPAVYLSVKTPLPDQNGNPAGLIGISHDITTKKERDQLQQENMIYEEKLGAMHTLASSIAHEIRTPLAGIKAGINVFSQVLPDLLNAWQALPDNDKDVMQGIKIAQLNNVLNNTNILVDYANRTLDITLLNIKQNNLLTASYQTVNIAHAIRDAVKYYPCSEEQRGLFKLNLADDLIFTGNDELLRNVLWNLFKNSLYAIQQANAGEITITLSMQDNKKLITVKDTGIGMPKDLVDTIFDKFQTSKEFGNGLGLAFCKVIIESFGGKISCESKPGEYSCFMILLP